MMLNRFRRFAAKGLEHQQKRRQQDKIAGPGRSFPQLQISLQPLYRVWCLPR